MITNLRDRNHPYHAAPRGKWLIAQTPTTAPYPCRCRATSRCDPQWCPCNDRTDIETMPTICCGRREAETRRRAEESETE